MLRPTDSQNRIQMYQDELTLDGANLSIAQLSSVISRSAKVSITKNESIHKQILKSVDLVREAVDNNWKIYGVTTGFGSMADIPVPKEDAAESQSNLLSFLKTGAGRPIENKHVRAAMILRANMLLKGLSGVRLELIKRMVRFINENAIPVVCEHGSIGASGDLVPLACLARAITGLQGSNRVSFQGEEIDGLDALNNMGIEPIELLPKEALGIVNGTSFSAAIAANCVHSTRSMFALTMGAHAIFVRSLLGYEEPFAEFVHENKPHPGQLWTAHILRDLLKFQSPRSETLKREHVQDRYSIRCMPQYLGPIVEGIARVADVVETEMNSVTDNPLIDAENEKFYQGGNFLGQYIGMAMDDLRRYLGLLAKHLDVQIALLVAPEFNHGLPASLKGSEDVSYNMGLKGLQITANSIMPQLTFLGNSLVEHYPTHAEQFNQNINGLSWGSANLACQSVELYRHYLATTLIFAVQSIDLRAQMSTGSYDGRKLLSGQVTPLYESVCKVLDASMDDSKPLLANDVDRSLDIDIAKLAADIESDGSLINSVLPILEQIESFRS